MSRVRGRWWDWDPPGVDISGRPSISLRSKARFYQQRFAKDRWTRYATWVPVRRGSGHTERTGTDGTPNPGWRSVLVLGVLTTFLVEISVVFLQWYRCCEVKGLLKRE